MHQVKNKIRCIECAESADSDDNTIKWAIKCSSLNIGVHLHCAAQSVLDRFMGMLFIKNFFKNNAVRVLK